MLTNKEIARQFNDLAGLMELHKESSFRIRNYSNAYITLRKLGEPIAEMSTEKMATLKGIGKSTASKIKEIIDTGEMTKLKEFQAKTPPGIQDILKIKGLGPKKIRQLWKELEIESIGELWYACNENRLISLKGFGTKTQLDVLKKIEYFQQSRGKFHYARLENEALELVATLKKHLNTEAVYLTGGMRRKMPVVTQIEILVAVEGSMDAVLAELMEIEETVDNKIKGKTKNETPLTLHQCSPNQLGSKLFSTTGPRTFLEAFLEKSAADDFKNLATEEAVFEKAALPYLAPELRDDNRWLATDERPKLVTEQDVKSVMHLHTTDSDGIHSLREMALYIKGLGYEYMGLTDHSQSAFYANGLKPDRVLQQMEEVDALNQELAPFKIFKGIESDIKHDGSLDYEEDILKKFDFIIASVHAHLKMDKEKATQRLLTAIENPYTTILGHPTGRLLLSREGYPIDHKKIIDACATNNVIIELNAHPFRLDLDWSWIPYALEKGVKISVNPDAHSKEGVHDIHFGICAARKGGLTASTCFNNLSLKEFEEYLSKVSGSK